MNDSISRQSAIDAATEYEKQLREILGDENELVEVVKILKYRLIALPSVQPEPSTEIQEILDYLDTTLHPIVSPDNWYVYAELHDMVSMMPSAQPEIVRCKDCKWFGDFGCAIRIVDDSDKPTENDFCSFAERKADETD